MNSLKADILVVDDNDINLQLITFVLEEHGYLVRPASSGKRALEEVEKKPPDLILLDVMMPEMDGFEVSARLHAEGSAGDVPIIFLSALSTVEDKIQAFEAGGVDYITKPFHTSEVLARVATHLKLRELQLQLQEQNQRLQHEISERIQAEQVEHRQRLMAQALSDTSKALTSTLRLEEVLDRIIVNIERVLPFDGVTIMLYEAGEVYIARSRGYVERGLSEFVQKFRYPVDEIENFNITANSGKPLVIEDTHNYSHWVDMPEVRWIRAHIQAPIMVRGQVVGLLSLDSETPGFYTEEHTSPLMDFADQAAIAFQNARLYSELERLAVMDELMGIHNRRGLFELGRREVNRAIRFERHLSALFLDIDDFGEFNHRYSYAVGDSVLRWLADFLRSAVRDTDLLGRYGGDEVVILMSETPLEKAEEIAQRLRAQVAEQIIPSTSGDLSITLSIGVTGLVLPSKGNKQPCQNAQDCLENLLEKAGRAAQQAKDNGRNCVVVLGG
ncbi:MAG TPA: diguanylate cyclase [Anaerolineaceae bacterium]|nr:diguanylate cyclase [Anaerolineaceae bacterium]